MAERTSEKRRPVNLDEAPTFLSQVDAASALGISLYRLALMEKDPTFPQRIRMPFGQTKMFRRDDLIAWSASYGTAGELGGAA